MDDTLHSRLLAKLAPFGQEHVLGFWPELDARRRRKLAGQIDSLDLPLISRLLAESHDGRHRDAELSNIGPCQALRLDGSGASFSRDEAHRRGDEAIAAGEVGVMIVAGGQGARLGFPHPKGMFPLGPLSGRTLFQMLFEQVFAAQRYYRTRLPVYVMTSPATDEETRSFLADHKWFGLDEEQVRLFCQGVMPAVDAKTKKLLLEEKDELFLAPDGHGGMLAAFEKCGALADAKARELKRIFYAQIDNPLARLPDPLLIGCHLLSDAEMTTQVVAKSGPLQKVGNVASLGDRACIVEYSDLPRPLAERRNPDGSLWLWAGSLAIHVLELAFLERMAKRDDGLPFHRALKATPFIDPQGVQQRPAEPNAIKFERFIFDLMPAARSAFAVETREADSFAPVKNASGEAVDTPETSRAMLIDRDRRWLRAAGAVVDDDVIVEISPLFAWTEYELKMKTSIQPGQRIADSTYFT